MPSLSPEERKRITAAAETMPLKRAAGEEKRQGEMVDAMRTEEEIRQTATIIKELQPENRRDVAVLEWVLGGPSPNQAAQPTTTTQPGDIPARVLKVVGLAAMVAMYDWGTSVSEAYHNERMAAMERLRQALPAGARDDTRGL